jgi:D-cysteine desulfhydrase
MMSPWFMPESAIDRLIVRRFPALAALPHVALCTLPTPLERVASPDGRTLLLKRDDLTADPLGGNKARGLEWIIGALRAGDRVVTVGPTGSNSALATAIYASRMGAITTVVRWRQEMNQAATVVGAHIRDRARVIDASNVVAAYVVATVLRWQQDAAWVPAGAATPRAILGHVNAALELGEQLRDAPDMPTRIFVPLGTGGTAAGLVLGLRIAGLSIPVTAVRVVPRAVGTSWRVASLANRAARLIELHTGERLPRIAGSHITVAHGSYGGAYGRPLPGREGVAAWAAGAGLALDDTYSLKACAAALSSSEPTPLLWLTFDGRVLRHRWPVPNPGNA